MCVQDCWSALISAAKEGHLEVVRELLENSAYIEHRDMVRPHTHTLSYHHSDRQSLVYSWFKVDGSSLFQGGWTALMWAAYKGRCDVVKLLLENGANPNTTGQVTHTHTHRS